MNNNIKFWEILVPCVSNEGIPYRTRFHRVWDKKVRDLTGGLTIMSPVRGQWVNKIHETETVYIERMIPVRIACSEEQIEKIADMTGAYYKQLAVIYYLISDKVFIKEYANNNKQ